MSSSGRGNTREIIASSDNLSVKLPRRVLSFPGFSLPSGEALIIAGPNGSGKTTLLRTIAGIYKPLKGELKLLAQPFLVEENQGYDPKIRAGELISIVSHLSSLPHNTLSETIRRLEEELTIDQAYNLKISQLSRGWRKRVLISLAFLSGRDLLLFDEPLDGLDESGVKGFLSLVRDFLITGSSRRGVILALQPIKSTISPVKEYLESQRLKVSQLNLSESIGVKTHVSER